MRAVTLLFVFFAVLLPRLPWKSNLRVLEMSFASFFRSSLRLSLRSWTDKDSRNREFLLLLCLRESIDLMIERLRIFWELGL